MQGRARLPSPLPRCYVKTKLRPTYLLFLSNTLPFPPPPTPKMFPTPYLTSGAITDVTLKETGPALCHCTWMMSPLSQYSSSRD